MATDARPGAAEMREDRSRRRADRAQRGFVVPITALRKHLGSSRQVSVDAAVADLGALGVFVPDDAPVHVDLVLTSDPGGLTANGTIEATWVGECRRCGGVVDGQVAAAVRERFAPTGSDDEDAYPLAGDTVDLEPLVRDVVLLELPLAPLCAETCLGLCPQCGTNWNEGPCQCRPAADPRWSVLDELREPPG